MTKGQTEYIYIEDKAMLQLRHKEDWALKSMPEEVLLPLLNAYRDHLYFLGLKRILIKMIAGTDFKLVSDWNHGSCQSFFFVCKQNDFARNMIPFSQYGFRAGVQCDSFNIGRIRSLLLGSPFTNRQMQRGRYIRYIANDTFKHFGKRVGRCEGGILLINKMDVLGTYHSQQDRLSCANEEDCPSKTAIKSQNHIIRLLINGYDFILPPYGHSLQSLLGALTYRRYALGQRFRLCPLDAK